MGSESVGYKATTLTIAGDPRDSWRSSHPRVRKVVLSVDCVTWRDATHCHTSAKFCYDWVLPG
eukprot:1135712-Amorphochlora_amoeboformis.AAC.1